MFVREWLGHKTLSRVLLAGSAVVGLSAVSGFAYAQDATAQDGAGNTVETIVVTGSKIARKDADSVGPLTTLTPADIKNTGSYDIGNILQKLPVDAERGPCRVGRV